MASLGRGYVYWGSGTEIKHSPLMAKNQILESRPLERRGLNHLTWSPHQKSHDPLGCKRVTNVKYSKLQTVFLKLKRLSLWYFMRTHWHTRLLPGQAESQSVCTVNLSEIVHSTGKHLQEAGASITSVLQDKEENPSCSGHHPPVNMFICYLGSTSPDPLSF